MDVCGFFSRRSGRHPYGRAMQRRNIWWVAARAAPVLLWACGGSEHFGNLMDLGACDPTTTAFADEIDNPFFPLAVGFQSVLEGEESGSHVLVRVTVLEEAERVAGISTRVVEEYEATDGHVVEISRNYFAQTRDGTVCYFGEDVDVYDANGNVTGHSGTWRADGSRYQPGIFMPSSPVVGMAFQQEVAPGVAEDQSNVVALGESTEVPAGTFTGTVTVLDLDPLGGGKDTKVYARGIGLIVDETAVLTHTSTAA
jgi:hypothetical protein